MIETLPGGVVTFLMTDIEGSTRLWDLEAEAMSSAMGRHDDIIDQVVGRLGGHVIKDRGEGDSRFTVFASGSDALAAAVAIQQDIAQEPWETTTPMRIRAGIHTGFANPVNGDYYGSAVNRCARIRSLGHGGQTLLSMSTHEVIKDDSLPQLVTLRDLGEHFLKDLTRPERLFQVDIAGLPNDFPGLSPTASTPNNLPKQLTEFVGRQQEIAQMRALLKSSRMVTILAPGGTGKTRLALQVSSEALGDFPHGVFQVELAPVTSPAQIAQGIAEAIDVPLSSEDDPLDQLLRYLVNKRMLLILDNFEHLVDGASTVDEILRAAPLTSVLATSRVKLGLSSETILTLPGLDVSWETADQAPRTDGARLFTVAAQRANPGYTLADSDLASLRRILEAVQGMPLGILLAAGWADMLSVDEIAAEIDKSSDFLETQMGDVPDRHRSVRAVFDYSWSLLSPEERQVFSALSVFRGGFTRDAAEHVAGASLRGLSNLVDKSFVAADPDRGRFVVHELLRQYGAAHLESDPEHHRQITERHAAHYADVMDQASALIRRSDQPQALTMMEADLDNIRAAWRHYSAGDDPVTPVNMVEGLWFLYEVRGWYQPALEIFEEPAPTPVTGAARAWFQSLLSQPELGAGRAEEAAEELRQSTDAPALLFALQSLALSTMYAGDITGLQHASEEMMALAKRHQDPWWVIVGSCWLMFPDLFFGRIVESQELAQFALDESKEVGDHWCRTFALYCLSQIAMREGRPKDALAYLQQSEAISREIGYRRGLQWSLKEMGQAASADRDLITANGYYLESLDTSYDLGQTREMLSVLVGIAQIRMASGEHGVAAELLGTVLADPAGSQLVPPDLVTIHGSAEELRTELSRLVDPDTLADGLRRGSTRTTEAAARHLLAPDST